MTGEKPLLVEWYRVDDSRRITRVLALAALLMLLGCLGVVFGIRATHRPEFVRAVLGTLGFACVLSGGLRAIFGLRGLLLEDAYLALQTDALVFHEGARHVEIDWDSLEAVTPVPGGVALVTKDGESLDLVRTFAGVTPGELAKRITHVRRRVLFGLER